MRRASHNLLDNDGSSNFQGLRGEQDILSSSPTRRGFAIVLPITSLGRDDCHMFREAP
jgi:hypothetical protein